MGVMAETPETQLIEALKKVDVYGDIAPPHVQDPMTMVLRQNAIQADLIRWDAKFVLTGTGRNRITARSRSSGKILRFKMCDKNDGRAPLRKPDFCAPRPIPVQIGEGHLMPGHGARDVDNSASFAPKASPERSPSGLA